MSDIYRAKNSGNPSAQEAAQSVAVRSEQQASEEQQRQMPTEENQKRFAQKVKGEKSQKAEAETDKTPRQAGAKNIQRQERKENAWQHAQKEDGLIKNEETSLQKKEENSQQKANAILQGLHGANPVTQTNTAAAIEQPTATQATDRLLNEFQTVADRVMLTNSNLQQGGSIRLQLSNSVLPGTSVTFAMVGGTLHATFSGNNKDSLDRIRSHKEKLTEHVRKHSGVAIVVEAKNEDSPEKQSST